MRIQDKGRPLHPDAHFKIRPRIFLEGNFFVDVTPGTVGQGGRRQPHLPGQPDRHPGPDRPGADRAADRHARGPQDAAARVRRRPRGQAAARASTRSIKYWKPAYRDSAIVSEAMLGEKEHDLSGYIDRAGVVAGALDRNRGQLKALITNFRQTAGAFARENQNLEAAIAELPRTLRAAQPALDALNRSFPGLRGFARDLRPGVESSGPDDRRLAAAAAPAARPRLEVRAARADRRPAADDPGAGELHAGGRAAQPPDPRVRELPERGHPAVEQGQADRRQVPVDRPGLHGAAQAVPGPRGREPLR